MTKSIFAAFLFCLFSMRVFAATHYVSTNGTSAYPYSALETGATNIQDAVDVADDGDVVLVGPGTYNTGVGRMARDGTNEYGLCRVLITNAITVQSLYGPTSTVIVGSKSSGIRCVFANHTNAALLGFTLSEGRAIGGAGEFAGNGGGALLCRLKLMSNCIIRSCSVLDWGIGGGVGTLGATHGGPVHITHCTLEQNQARFGGGISILWGGSVVVENCLIQSNNAAEYGGGMMVDNCREVRNCRVVNNQASTMAGGVFMGSYAGISNCVVMDNSAGGNGGGAYNGRLDNCSIVGNHSDAGGGGVCASEAHECVFTNNSAVGGGGAAWSTLYNSLLAGNSATNNGGGSLDGTLYNCTLAGNSAGTEGGGASVGSLNNCIVYNNTSANGSNYFDATFTCSCTAPLPSGAGNRAADPLFVNFAAGNLRLSSNSPCINAGTNQAWMTSATDLDGQPRLYGGGLVDMGAYEYQAPVTHAYYVSTNGLDANPGSPSLPFLTIQRAVDVAVSGETVYVQGGDYREAVTVTKSGIAIEAHTNESPVIKGSVLQTEWTLYDGAIWKTTFDVKPQQVFVDDVPLKMIGYPNRFHETNQYGALFCKLYGTNLVDLFAGSFFYETNNSTLYVWLSDSTTPSNHIVEVSRRYYTLLSPKDSVSVRIKGICFKHSNSLSEPGAEDIGAGMVRLRNYATIEDCDIVWGDSVGLFLGSGWTNVVSQGSRAIRCNVSHNGQLGISWRQLTSNITVQSCTVYSNNYREFVYEQAAGGIKVMEDASGTVESNDIAYNIGAGVWFDVCRDSNRITIRGNHIHDHTNWFNPAIIIEVSRNALIEDNLLARNMASSEVA